MTLRAGEERFRVERYDELLAFVLVLSVGYVDGFGLSAYGTFLSFMSGNTTLTGYNIGQGMWGAALPTAIAILGFVCGATVGTAITWFTRRPRRLIVATVATLQAVVFVLSAAGAISTVVAIAVIAVAMGMLNRAVTHIGGQSISLTFISGTLSQLGNHLARAIRHEPLADGARPSDTHGRRAVELAGVWCAFFVGAIIAGAIAPRLRIWTLAPSIVMLAALAFIISP